MTRTWVTAVAARGQGRCTHLVPLDQPICRRFEIIHFGERHIQEGTFVPLDQP